MYTVRWSITIIMSVCMYGNTEDTKGEGYRRFVLILYTKFCVDLLPQS